MDFGEIAPARPDYSAHRERLLKWLPVLMGCTAASMLCGLVTALLENRSFMTLISSAVSVFTLVALFSLAPVHERFRKGAILSAVAVGGTLLVLFFNMALLSLVASVCSIIGAYHQLNGLSEITAPLDARLSRNWHSLFLYELIIGILSGVFSSAGVVIAVMADLNPETIVKVTLVFTALVSAALSLVRILWLKRTIALYQEG